MDHFIFFVFLAFIVFSNAHLIARKKRPVLKEKRPLRIRPKKRPHEAPAPCDGAAAVLAESKDRGPLKESLEELRKAQKAVQTAHRRHSRQQKLREGILWSVILEKKW